ncbi:hypothetical protein B0H19DRAFT_657190 [Mycena capillaripes]|nr:hypothetical protein B0H19DRAFT_657190 [Mycena capillaripes]
MKSASPLCALPVEIMGIISEFSTIVDLVQLCRTSRRIHSVCFRFIYRVLELQDFARTIKCCETLTSNIFYAQEVRMLKMLCYPKYPLGRFRAVLQSAISNLPNLENLHVYIHPSLFACFSDLHFPRLRACSIPLVLPDDYYYGQNPSASLALSVVPTYMPHLRMFFGPETFALKVIPQSRTSHLSIWWNTRRLQLNNPSDDVAILSLSGAKISILENVVGIWDTSLLSAITVGLPHLTKLEFRNISPPERDILQIFISHLDAAITGLSSLASLSILQNPLRPPGFLDPRDLDGEFDAVRRWGEISPTLRSAVLPSETAWARVHVRENVWYPATKSPNRPDMLVRVKWFLCLVVSSRNLCAGYARVAEAVAGKDSMTLLRVAVDRVGRIPEFEIEPTATGMSILFAG